MPPRSRIILSAAFIGLAVSGLICHRKIHDLREAAERVTHTHEVIGQLRMVLADLAEAESGQRGYLLTGRDNDLKPFQRADAQLPARVEALAVLTADNPAQSARLRAAHERVVARLRVARRTIILRRESADGFARAVELVRSDEGNRLADEFRQILAEVEADEAVLMASRTHAARAECADALLALGTGTGVSLGLLGLAGVSLRREQASRRLALVVEGRARAELDRVVGERTGELVVAVASHRAGEARYRAVIESAADAIVTTDRAGTIVEWNPAAVRIFGYPPGEVLGREFSLLVSEQHAAVYATTVAGYAPGPGSGVLGRVTELVGRRAGGAEFPIEVTFTRWAAGGKEHVTAIIRDVSRRRRAEAELRWEQERFRAAFDRAGIGMALVDSGGRFLKVNSALCGILGYRAPDLLATSLGAVIHPDDRDTELAKLGPGEPGEGAGYATEKRYAQRDGSIRWGALTVSAVTTTAGEISFFIIQIQDVTERRRAEDAVRASEGRYRALIEATNQMVWSWVPGENRGDFTQTQRWWEDTTGQPPAEQMAGATGWLAAVHPEDRERVAAAWTQAVAQNVGYNLEYRVPTRAGGYRHVRSRLVVVRTPDGRCEWVGTLNDVTEQHAAEAALRASEERFRQMAEAIDEVFWLADPVTLDVLYVNPAFERVWGVAPAALYERPGLWLATVHPSDRAAVEAQVARGRQGEAWSAEYRVIRPDGGVRWVHDSGFPIRTGDGRVRRVAGVAADVTDRHNLEAQLHQAQKMEALGRLAGGVAHDFNNLLTVIIGYSELLLAARPGDDPTELLGDILGSGRRAADLTRQLLAFSRRQVLNPQRVDLNGLVTGLRRLLDRVLGEDIDLVTALQPGLGRVTVDPGQLEQVLVNLAVNARDAMPGGGRLTLATTAEDVGARRGPPPGRYAVVTVTDTGTGMTDEVKARMFEPFFTTKPPGEGTGLGLSTVFGIVRQSHGHIEVESEWGHGTTVRVLLPMTSEAAESGTIPRPPARRGRETVLLAEDEDGVRRLTAHALRTAGYTVIEAADARAAIAARRSHPGPVHLLLTDVVMPGMSGSSLAAALREFDHGIRVMYMSGYTDDTVVRHGVGAEGTAFLQKPFSPDDLRHAVRRAIEGSDDGTGPELPVLTSPPPPDEAPRPGSGAPRARSPRPLVQP